MTITHDVEWLSPEDANRLLDLNTHNRPLNESDILKWATEMQDGNWKLNGEAIKIGSDNRILDGQHRLHAAALQDAGTAIPFLVVRGLDPDTQTTMDQGRKRSVADQINLSGIDVNKALAASIRIYMGFSLGLMFKDRKLRDSRITTPVIVEWAHSHPDLVELMRVGNSYDKIKTRPALVGMTYALIAQAHSCDVADEFFGRVQDGVGLELGSPILALRNKLDQIKGESGRTDRALKISERDLIGFIVVAFNAWICDKQLGKLQRPHGGTWTEDNFPRVIHPRRPRAVASR